MGKPIRLLIVDDSALVRNILKTELSKDPDIKIIGTASDVYSARDRIVLSKPDVITLDIEMPRMDGVEFLKRLMPQYPIPVIMVSALAAPGAALTLQALEYGAVDFALKPSAKVGSGLSEMIDELTEKIKTAAKMDVTKWKRTLEKSEYEPMPASRALENTTNKIIAIGASTGGTVALQRVLQRFPADIPGTVVVQHMPPVFTKYLAERLNDQTQVEVKEAESGDRISVGRVLIAPGDRHMEVVRSGGNYLVRCRDGEKVKGHRPSVDVLLRSVAKYAGSNAVGIVMTGMGADGAEGLVSMRNEGARTFAQDEASSVVFGMPKEAYLRGGAEKLVHLKDIPSTIIQAIKEMK